MRPPLVVTPPLFALLAAAAPLRAQQPASLAVLAPLPTRTGTCRTDAGLRTVVLDVDGAPSRSLSAVTNTRGAVVAFSSVAVGVSDDGRRQRETLSISFTDDERFVSGERRSITTDAAAVPVDDRHAPAGSGEALTALYLAKQVLARCAPGVR